MEEEKNDTNGRLILMRTLERLGYKNVTAQAKFCNYDVSAMLDGQLYKFELKERTFPSTKYGDTIIEQTKFERLQKHYPNVIICNIFTDHKLSLIPIETEHTHFKRTCPHCTYFSDKTMMPKLFCKYENKPEFMYEWH